MNDLQNKIKSFIPSDELIGFVDTMSLLELQCVYNVMRELNSTSRGHTISNLRKYV